MTSPSDDTVLEAAARAAYESWIAPVRDLEPRWEDLPESHQARLRESQAAAINEFIARRPAPDRAAPGEEYRLADEIRAELMRARAKFPGKNVTFAALVEEVGELATATFEESRAAVRKEAVQVAVMAMRMVLDGDCTFDNWRETKGLDPLLASGGAGC